ncbi:MAG: alpha/beta fold hydrolase [Pseudomonadota bacterium]
MAFGPTNSTAATFTVFAEKTYDGDAPDGYDGQKSSDKSTKKLKQKGSLALNDAGLSVLSGGQGGPSYDAQQASQVVDWKVEFPTGWKARSGAVLEEHDRAVGIRLRAIGPKDAPVIFVLGGISADRRAFDASLDKVEPGWWRSVTGPGGGVDTRRYRVISANFFPEAPTRAIDLTPADYAEIFHHALVQSGIDRLHALVGGSFGGMVSLEFAASFPDYVERLAILCASHRPSALGRAWRRIQRQVLALGLETGREDDAVAIARSLAMTTYRTPDEFNSRFSAEGSVESYLDHHGAKFAQMMGAARYQTLSASIDCHDFDGAQIDLPTLVIASPEDQLIAFDDARALAKAIGPNAQFKTLHSPYGHDAFLKEADNINPALREFLESTI